MTFRIVNESILDQGVDAIVNPANSFLQHGGGLARIIATAAIGPPLPNPGEDERIWFSRARLTPTAAAWVRGQSEVGLVPLGGAVLTSAGCLPFKAIIHAVGPIWGGGGFCEVDLLRSAYKRSLMLAVGEGYASIALPAISMGIFGVPRDVVASAACHAARHYSHRIGVTICLTSDEDVAAFEAFR